MSFISAFDVMGPNMIGPQAPILPELQESHFLREKC